MEDLPQPPAEPLVDVPEDEYSRDGNIFSIMGVCMRYLKRAGFAEEAKNMARRVHAIGTEERPIPQGITGYDLALQTTMEYVNLVGPKDDWDDAE